MTSLQETLRTIIQRERRANISKDAVTIGVQGVIVDPDKGVLLVHHGYRDGWHFPGGGVECGESLENALRRELLDEVGVVSCSPPRLHGVFSHFDQFPGDHIALNVIEKWAQPRVPAPNPEIVE